MESDLSIDDGDAPDLVPNLETNGPFTGLGCILKRSDESLFRVGCQILILDRWNESIISKGTN